VVAYVATVGVAWALTVWMWFEADRLSTTGVPMSFDMGGDLSPGAAALFLALWLPMMAAMMLPSAWPVALRSASLPAMTRFVAGYLLVWEGVGVLAYLGYVQRTARRPAA
jgi:predicted metal-binding membrane protein